MELDTSTRGLLNTHPLAWIALQPHSPSPHLCVSLTLHSSFNWLCHHRRRWRAWQFSPALISRHRLSVTRLILVSHFKLCFSLKHRYHAAWRCGWLSMWPLHFQGEWFTLTSMKVYCIRTRWSTLLHLYPNQLFVVEQSQVQQCGLGFKKCLNVSLSAFPSKRGLLNKQSNTLQMFEEESYRILMGN